MSLGPICRAHSIYSACIRREGCLGKQADDWSFALELFQSLEGHGLDLETWWSKKPPSAWGGFLKIFYGKKKRLTIRIDKDGGFFCFFRVYPPGN